MTKLQKNKKGFTLTELAIVIAVIAILVAVLVPTFTSLIKKAEESSDKQLVKNLNTILSTDDTINGNVESMSDAVAVAESNGYNVANLSPTSSGYDILWDQVNNRFFLVNEDNQVVYADSATGLSEGETVAAAYTYWRIIESESDYEKYSAENYSLYITTDLDVETVVSNGGVEYAEGVTSKATTVTAKTGSATTSTSSTESKALASTAIKTASDNTSLPLVIVKTNGGSLTVEVTGNATVKHNGTADGLNLNSGHYLRNATITGTSINWNSTDVSYEETEEITTSEGTSYVGFVFGKELSTDDVKTIVTNNITVSSTTVVTIGSVKDDVITDTLTSISVSYSIEVVTTTISTDFAGGLGTENNPYQIATAEQFTNITQYSDEMSNNKQYCFKLANDITLSLDDYYNSPYYNNSYFCGTFDGDGNEIHINFNRNGGYFSLFNYICGETTIKNVDLYSNSTSMFNVVWLMWGADYNGQSSYGSTWDKVTFYGINFYSEDDATISLNMSNTGFITANAIENLKESGSCEIVIEKCNVYASIQNVGTCTAAIVNNIFPEVTATIKDCVISGNITGNTQVGVITANSTYNQYYNTDNKPENVTESDVSNITISNVTFTGKASGKYVNAFSAGTLGDSWILNTLYQSSIGGRYITTDLSSYNFNVYTGNDGLYVEATSGANAKTYTYTVSLSVQAIDYTNGNVSNGVKFEMTGLTASNYSTLTALSTSGIYAYEYSTAVSNNIIASGTDLTSLISVGSWGGIKFYLYIADEGQIYLICEDTDEYKIESSVSVLVNAYSGDEYVGSVDYVNK